MAILPPHRFSPQNLFALHGKSNYSRIFLIVSFSQAKVEIVLLFPCKCFFPFLKRLYWIRNGQNIRPRVGIEPTLQFLRPLSFWSECFPPPLTGHALSSSSSFSLPSSSCHSHFLLRLLFLLLLVSADHSSLPFTLPPHLPPHPPPFSLLLRLFFLPRLFLRLPMSHVQLHVPIRYQLVSFSFHQLITFVCPFSAVALAPFSIITCAAITTQLSAVSDSKLGRCQFFGHFPAFLYWDKSCQFKSQTVRVLCRDSVPTPIGV